MITHGTCNHTGIMSSSLHRECLLSAALPAVTLPFNSQLSTLKYWFLLLSVLRENSKHKLPPSCFFGGKKRDSGAR